MSGPRTVRQHSELSRKKCVPAWFYIQRFLAQVDVSAKGFEAVPRAQGDMEAENPVDYISRKPLLRETRYSTAVAPHCRPDPGCEVGSTSRGWRW